MFYKVFFFVLINFFLIYLFTFLAKKLNLIDFPNKRKNHRGEVPLIGGIAIYLSIFIFLFFHEMPFWIYLIIYSSSVIVFLGVIDDAKQLGVPARLVSQIISSLIVVGGGLSIVDIGDYYYFPPYELKLFGILFTIFCVVGLTNAINFIDGIDGLASGLALVSLVSMFCFSLLLGNTQYLEPVIFLIISLIVFLLFNLSFLSLHKIFLGDSGSTMLGFVVGFLLIFYTHPEIRNFHPILAAWCVSLPIYDLFVVILRRAYRKINPFKPDRRHIHHLLLDQGLSENKVLYIIIICSVSLNLIGGIIYYMLGPLPSLLSFIMFFVIYMFLSFNVIRTL